MSCLTLVNIFQVEKFNRMLQNFPPKFIKRTLVQSCNFHRKLQQIIFHNVFHLHQCEALKSPKRRVNPPLFQFRDWIDCCRPSQLCSTYLIFIMFANLQILHSYDDTVDYIITNRAPKLLCRISADSEGNSCLSSYYYETLTMRGPFSSPTWQIRQNRQWLVLRMRMMVVLTPSKHKTIKVILDIYRAVSNYPAGGLTLH